MSKASGASVTNAVTGSLSRIKDSDNGCRLNVAAHARCFPLVAMICFVLVLTGGIFSSTVLAYESTAPAQLQCEGMQEPLGIDIVHPRLSWQVAGFKARSTADGV